MISKDLEAKILRLFHVEKWPPGTIARQCGCHHDTVQRVLAEAGVPAPERSKRPSKVDPFVPFIVEQLELYPTLRASRLFDMVRERGYVGHPDHFRHVVARHRPRRKAEAYLRLRTLAGEQGQVDWAHFGTVRVGSAERRLVCFVMVLSSSRKRFLHFGVDQAMSGFLRGHVLGFRAFGGVPRVLLYDNLKSAVLERAGDAIRFHPTLLEFAGHYRYEPRPVAVARGNEKGRVERAIRAVRDRFFAARQWKDIDDLNAQAEAWCEREATERPWPEDRNLTVQAAYELERPLLLPLPDDEPAVDERKVVTAGKTPYVRFDLNDYSVPHDRVQRQLVVLASEHRVRVLDGTELVAEHARSYDRDRQIEDRAHIDALVAQKRAAHKARATDRLLIAAPRARELLIRQAERGENLGASTAALLRLLEHYGAAELTVAIDEALAGELPHPAAVRQCLERRRADKGLPPPVSIVVSPQARARERPVKPHALVDYDHLSADKTASEPVAPVAPNSKENLHV